MFAYRSKHVVDRKMWCTIVEENIVMVLPVTPYRSFPPSQVNQGQRYLTGIDAILADISSHQVLYQSLSPYHQSVSYLYPFYTFYTLFTPLFSLICTIFS